MTAAAAYANHHHNRNNLEIPVSFDLKNLKVVEALGRGARGVVFLVRNDLSKEDLALKVVWKDSIEKRDKDMNNDGGEYKRICFEQQVLRRFNHPLLPNLRGVLITEKVVGYAMDYCSGRDLNFLRKRQTEKTFDDDIIRFYAAELVLALEYLHNLGIVYRDLKPDNIMIQENGHIMLVDFDLSTKLSPKSPQTSPIQISPPRSVAPKNQRKKQRCSPLYKWCHSGISLEDPVSPSGLSVNSVETESYSDSTEKSNSFVGTEDYVAPEVISGNGHDFSVDWWSLGIVLYEMLYSKTPFRGSNRKETFCRILTKSPELVGEKTPLRDLIGILLEKDPKQRIELEGIKSHEFFKGIEWDFVLEIARPPYIPSPKSNADEEDIEGINKIDMESFVQGIFGNGKDEIEKKKDEGGNDEIQKNNVENMNIKVWIDEVNNPTRNNQFLDF